MTRLITQSFVYPCRAERSLSRYDSVVLVGILDHPGVKALAWQEESIL